MESNNCHEIQIDGADTEQVTLEAYPGAAPVTITALKLTPAMRRVLEALGVPMRPIV